MNSYRLIVLLTGLILTAVLCILTINSLVPEGGNYWYLLLIQMLGPIGGWVDSILIGKFFQAFWLLTLSAIISGIPIYLYVKSFKHIHLFISCVSWYFFGYMFSIGIWI